MILSLLLLALGSQISYLEAQQTKEDVIGIWETEEKNGKFDIRFEDGELIGRLEYGAKMLDENGNMRRDELNKDESLRPRLWKGSICIWGLEYAGDLEWEDGFIYDFTTGNTWRCDLILKGDILVIRGYVGWSIFGKSIECHRSGD